MKKTNFNLFNRLFNNRQPLFPWFDFKPLSSPTFFTAIFKRFSLPNQLILAKKRDQKHYQIKLKSEFINSGSPLARLLSPLIKKSGRPVPDFPQIPVKSSSLTLSNYINLTAFAVIYPFLKKQAKITYQSGSNYSAITAEKKYTGLFLKSNLTGNNQQQKHDYRYPPRNAGQIQGSGINHLTPFNKKSDRYKDIVPYTKNLAISTMVEELINAATNQATAILEKNSDKRFVWTTENTINLVYHHPCN